jgi:hypothetical protein
VEQKQSHARHDEFAEQFTSVMLDRWSDILHIMSRQSPRVATLLRAATPVSLKRMNGMWRIQVTVRRATLYEKLRQPRDNEIVSQAIRLWAHSAAQLKLPRVTVDLDP